MLDENPFLEVAEETAVREEFGLEHVNTPVSQDSREFESATDSGSGGVEDAGTSAPGDAEVSAEPKLEEAGKATARWKPRPTTANGAAMRRRARTTTTRAIPRPPT